MSFEIVRKMAERKLCGDKKLKCEKKIEFGEDNFKPFQKIFWVCTCKSRKINIKKIERPSEMKFCLIKEK